MIVRTGNRSARHGRADRSAAIAIAALRRYSA